MAYPKRVWVDGPNEWATYEDFNRIEGGVSDNDKQISILSGNGFNGVAKPLLDFADYNTFVEEGIYHGVYTNAKINDPIQIGGIRRVTITNRYLTKAVGTKYQKVRYDDGVSKNRTFERLNNEKWIEIITPDKVDVPLTNGWTLQHPDFEKAISVSGNTATISVILYNALQQSSNIVIAKLTNYIPVRHQRLTGHTDSNAIVKFTIDTGGILYIDGSVPPHAWISLVSPYIL